MLIMNQPWSRESMIASRVGFNFRGTYSIVTSSSERLQVYITSIDARSFTTLSPIEKNIISALVAHFQHDVSVLQINENPLKIINHLNH